MNRLATNIEGSYSCRGKNDYIFPAEGAHPYLRDLPAAELHLLDTGHFALEEDGARIAGLMREFLSKRLDKQASAVPAGGR